MSDYLWWAGEPLERQPAWERKYKGRIAWELRQLNARGKVFQVRRDLWEIGHFAVDYEWAHSEKTYRLTIVYPGGFPHVRPTVYLHGDRKLFPRKHCNPLDGRLCYLGHGAHEWQPQHSIAQLIDEQLPKILDGTYVGHEEAIAEPAEHWWNAFAAENSCFLIDSAWSVGEAMSGSFRLQYHFADQPAASLRGIATEVMDHSGNHLFAWSSELPREFRGLKSIEVPWIRSEDEIFPRNGREIYDAYKTLMGNKLRPRSLGEKVFGYVFAVVYPTELEYGKSGGESWVLFIAYGSPKDVKSGADHKLTVHTVRTLRAGIDDRNSRAPSSQAIRKHRIAVVGLGAVGAPIAGELARNGASELDLIDLDRVTPGNSVRWPLGEPAWGYSKVAALRAFIENHYSTTKIHPHSVDVGEMLGNRTPAGMQLVEAFQNASVVIDATTSFDLLAAIFTHCASRNTPVISVNATPSVKGGAVTLYLPGGACPTCLLMHYDDETSLLTPPLGEGDEGYTVHPTGCAEATFTGASFDLQELSLQAVRALISVIEGTPKKAMIATLSFVEGDFGRVPEWQVSSFDKHPSCCA